VQDDGRGPAPRALPRLLPHLAIAGGVLLLAAGAVLIGRPAAVAVADAVPTASPVPPTAAPVRVTPRPPAAASPAASPSPAAMPAATPPVELTVRTPRVTARVVPVLADRTGALELPADPATFGWWAAGAAPAATTGSVVLAAHVDAVGHGAGPMSRLARAPMGTRITVTDAGGADVTYRLDSRRTIDKAALPADLFRLDGDARLVLVTCGGAWRADIGHYADNVVVTAEPVGG